MRFLCVSALKTTARIVTTDCRSVGRLATLRRSGCVGMPAGRRGSATSAPAASCGGPIGIAVRAATGGVVIEHLFERGDAAIVHVRRGDRDVAHGGRLELAGIAWIQRGVMHGPVAEREAAVAAEAARAGVVAGVIAIVGRPRGDDGAFETR